MTTTRDAKPAAGRRPRRARHDLGVPPDRAGEAARPDWRSRAACRGTELSLFFGSLREPANARRARLAAAKQICAVCPVRDPCLAFALRHHEEFGVWGGLTETERRRLSTPSRHR